MPRIISQSSIQEVKQVADIVSVVSEYVQLTNRGVNWFGCCPFHSEKTPSFSVNVDRKFYHCFGCKASGNVIKFVQEIEKISFPEAIERLAKRYGVELHYDDGEYVPDESEKRKKEYIELYNRMAGSFHYILTQTESGANALKYIKGRGLTDETIEKFRLGYAPADRFWLRNFLKSQNFTDDFLAESGLFSRKYRDIAFFTDRLMFPIFNRNGDVVAFGGRTLRPDGVPKYLNSTDLMWYQKGETLFGFNFAKQSIRTHKKVIFCEGYMDCIAYHQCGIDYAVAPLGTALTEQQVRMVKSMANEVDLSFDSDGAGQNATKRAILMCRKQNLAVKVVHLKGGKDPAEIMINFGKDYLTSEVENSIFDFDHLLMSLTQKFPVDTPEGKSNIAMELFDYVDALQSDIQKESTLNLIAQKIGLSVESIRNDFENREQAKNRLSSYSILRQQNGNAAGNTEDINVKPDAEFRAMLAVIADMKLFDMMSAELSESDFENPLARSLFASLKECHESGAFSFESLQMHCHNEKILQMINESIITGEYAQNTEQSVADSIKMIKRKCLIKKQSRLQNSIQNLLTTAYDGEELQTLIEEKMAVDKQLNDREF
ncbi:MAG: DNA primase [Treponema sp.]|nr:DNA primase [Treponema sp.]